MGRERQKADRKLKRYADSHGGQLPDGASFDSPRRDAEKPWLNHEGYHDPTAYAAIRNAGRKGCL